MLKVSFGDGRSLKCTEYHKFHISTQIITENKGGNRFKDRRQK